MNKIICANSCRIRFIKNLLFRNYGCSTSCESTTEKSEKYEQKGVRVAVLGASSVTGQTLALLLKQNPLITHIFLYDKDKVKGIAADLKHLDTRSDVTGFAEPTPVQAVRNAEIIVLLGIDKFSKDVSLKDRMVAEGKNVMKLAACCATFAPKSILIDTVYPVSMTLPLISEIYRAQHWYHPGKVIASVANLQMRINTFLAKHLHLDPTSIHVPLLGGPEEDIIIPLFSRAIPSSVSISDARLLVNRFKGLDDVDDPSDKAKVIPEYSPHSKAFAINRLVTTVALGLLGDSNAINTAFVRSNFITTCKHLVTTVRFGPHGVVHNYGIPRLTKFELQMFEQITLELEKREKIAYEYLQLSQSPATLLNMSVLSHEDSSSKNIFSAG